MPRRRPTSGCLRGNERIRDAEEAPVPAQEGREEAHAVQARRRGETEMIVKTKKGFQVKSHKGRPLSKPGLSKKAAKNRLSEVEFFKKRDK